MQTIKIASNDTITAPPVGQPDLPGQQTTQSQKPPETGQKGGNNGIPGSIPDSDVFKAVEGTKISTLSPMGGNDPLLGQPMGNSVPIGGLIDGGLAVELMDALLPSILVAVMAAIGAQMKKTDLQLTAREKTTLTPLMQKCMDQLMVNFQSPFAALGVSMLIIYGAKVTEHGVIQMIDKKAEKANREREQKLTTVTTPKTEGPKQQEILKPANVVAMTINKPLPAVNSVYEPTDEEIFMAKKILGTNYSRTVVITRLKNEKKKGNLEHFLNRKQKR